MAKHMRRQLTKLSYPESQNIGYCASFRDPFRSPPRRKRFGIISETDVWTQYARRLSDHMSGFECHET